jgi:hypothetical protein
VGVTGILLLWGVLGVTGLEGEAVEEEDGVFKSSRRSTLAALGVSGSEADKGVVNGNGILPLDGGVVTVEGLWFPTGVTGGEGIANSIGVDFMGEVFVGEGDRDAIRL